jgi:hypothetical protein
MLLNIDLAEELPLLDYTLIDYDCIFIGCNINDLYDERRVKLNSYRGVEPGRFKFKNQRLYGFNFEPKGPDKLLFRNLTSKTNFDIISYSNLVEKFNYNIGENFAKLHQNVFPVDPVYIERYMPGYRYKDILLLDAEMPEFQQFTMINMYFLPNTKN